MRFEYRGEVDMRMDGKFVKSVSLLILFGTLLLALSSHRSYATYEPNLALNQTREGFPQATASYTCFCDDVTDVVYGDYDYTGENRDRWTNWPSTAADWVEIDFGAPTVFNQVKLYIFSDGGGVQPPSSYQIQYWQDANWDWADVANATKSPVSPAAELNTVDFDPVVSNKVRVQFMSSISVGLVEFEVFLHDPDAVAAYIVQSSIEQLPAPAALNLADKYVVMAFRAAYENLTPDQKAKVNNLSRLTDAEAAIAAMEDTLSDIAVLSAYGNAEGNRITLKIAGGVDTTYNMRGVSFQLEGNGVAATVTKVVYDPVNLGKQTIELLFSEPVLLNEAPLTLLLQDGALKTHEGYLNRAITSIPVITFKRLDSNLDNRIGMDDIVRIIADPTGHIDVNQDGRFDREDIGSLLNQIPRYFFMPV